nr:hypothetical protein Itr_chr01CG06120 [Ipomoea trifida]
MLRTANISFRSVLGFQYVWSTNQQSVDGFRIIQVQFSELHISKCLDEIYASVIANQLWLSGEESGGSPRGLNSPAATRQNKNLGGAQEDLILQLQLDRTSLALYKVSSGKLSVEGKGKGILIEENVHMEQLNPRKRKIKPKTATDKGDGSSTAVPNAVPTQTAPIHRQPNPRVRKQKQTCGTQPTARQSKLIPRKRKINQTTLNESVGGSNPVVPLGIVVTVGPVNALKQMVL